MHLQVAVIVTEIVGAIAIPEIVAIAGVITVTLEPGLINSSSVIPTIEEVRIETIDTAETFAIEEILGMIDVERAIEIDIHPTRTETGAIESLAVIQNWMVAEIVEDTLQGVEMTEIPRE